MINKKYRATFYMSDLAYDLSIIDKSYNAKSLIPLLTAYLDI